MSNLQQLDEVLDFLNGESIDSLLWFNINDTLEIIIYNIKKAIVKLIDNIQNNLSFCKDSKIKSILQNILSNLKSLLIKADDIDSQEDANKISIEIKEEQEKIRKNVMIGKYISNGKVNRAELTSDIAYGILDLNDINFLWSIDDINKSYIGSFSDWSTHHQELSNISFYKSKKDLEKLLCASVAEVFDKNYCLFLYQVRQYLKKKHKIK